MNNKLITKIAPREQLVLDFLKETPGQVKSLEDVAAILGYEGLPSRGILVRTYIHRLRAAGCEITTVWGRGYMVGTAYPCQACNGTGFQQN